MNKELYIYAGLVTAGLGGGFTGGYFFAKKRFQAIADVEIAQIKHAYNERNLEKPPIEEVARELLVDGKEEVQKAEQIVEAKNMAEKLGYIPGEVAPESDFTQNLIEVESDENLFLEREDAPFMVSIDDFHDAAHDRMARANMVYYRGDNTLATEDDQVVAPGDVDEIVGVKALTMFGPNSRSEDDTIIYVRNPQMNTQYEVILREDSYQEVVLGISPQE
jgi:hypothetical protein